MSAVRSELGRDSSVARLLFDQAPEALLIYAPDADRLVDANSAAAALFECSMEELLESRPDAFHDDGADPKAGRRQCIEEACRLALDGHAVQREVSVRTAKGTALRCELRLVRVAVAKRTLIRASYVDITERLRAQAAIQADHAQMAEMAQYKQAILDNVMEAVITADSDGCIQSFNRAATRIFGYPQEEAIGMSLSMLMPRPDGDRHASYVSGYEKTGRARVIGLGRDTRGRHKSGREFPIHLSVSAIEGPGRPNYVGLIRDISEQREAESHIERLAYFDTLTGLPNRRLLLDNIAQAQRRCAGGGHAALVLADIDQFKNVNEVMGHAAGDALLRDIGAMFAHCVGESGMVARHGGDEFAMLIENLGADPALAAREAMAWCQRLLETARRQHGLFGCDYRTSASLGAIVFHDRRETPEALLAHADLALHQAKSESKDTYRLFDEGMGRDAVRRANLLHDLRLALPRQELVLMYQPQVSAQGRTLGAECLVRWRHPTRGMVSPADFIPLAEQSGFIIEIGEWVLNHACTTLQRWGTSSGMADLSLAVNISATEFRHPDFIATVARALEQTGASPSRLKLELTESVLAMDLCDLAAQLKELKSMGLGISLDDFGTGYSSISYLRQLPLDQLKIDRSFIVDIANNPRDEVLVRGLVDLCEVLGLAVVVEGVETTAQRDKLLACGCDCFQGFLTGRPMSEVDLTTAVGTSFGLPQTC